MLGWRPTIGGVSSLDHFVLICSVGCPILTVVYIHPVAMLNYEHTALFSESAVCRGRIDSRAACVHATCALIDGPTCVAGQVTCVGFGVRNDVWSTPMLDPYINYFGKGVCYFN